MCPRDNVTCQWKYPGALGLPATSNFHLLIIFTPLLDVSVGMVARLYILAGCISGNRSLCLVLSLYFIISLSLTVRYSPIPLPVLVIVFRFVIHPVYHHITQDVVLLLMLSFNSVNQRFIRNLSEYGLSVVVMLYTNFMLYVTFIPPLQLLPTDVYLDF